MLVHFGAETLDVEWNRAVVCIGTFDGVHLGHRAVIGETCRQAQAEGLPSVLVTFDRHPSATLAPENCPPAIASLEQNLARFQALGVSMAVILAFDRHLAETEAETFFKHVLVSKLRAGRMVVGHDFAFGKGRAGTPKWLSGCIDTTVVPPFELFGKRVSSREIRCQVEQGDVTSASLLLGEPFSLSAVVVGGERLGRTLGFPTLNLARASRQLVPGNGVYASRCRTRHGDFKAATSIGVRPAVHGAHRTIEAYLLDYPGDDLYGQAIELSFEQRLREERNFANLDELRRQIELDVREVAQR